MASRERIEGSWGIDPVPERLRVLGTLDLVQRLDPPGWGVGATVPSFLASFAVAAVVALVSRRSGAPTPAT